MVSWLVVTLGAGDELKSYDNLNFLNYLFQFKKIYVKVKVGKMKIYFMSGEKRKGL